MLNDDLIKKIDNLIDSGVKVPGFGKKVMLDTTKIDQFIKEVTDLVPQDIQEAKEIINQKNSILAQANMEAQRIIESANRDSADSSSKSQDEFEKLVDESSITEEANKKSESLIQNSKNKCEGTPCFFFTDSPRTLVTIKNGHFFFTFLIFFSQVNSNTFLICGILIVT